MLTNRVALFYGLAGTFLFGAMFGFISASQQIFVELYGLGPYFPVAFAVMAGTIAVAQFINSRVVRKVGMRRLAHTANLVYLGMALVLVGVMFEGIGDLQLARFKRDPENRGRVMDRGLWRYTRHPNYFGDFLVWWGLFAIAAATGAWWTVVSPVLMSLLLLRVSGVTLLEKSLRARPGYEEYVRRTSAFIPWLPRRS